MNMVMRRLRAPIVAAMVVCLCSGCVVVPTQVYVADATAGVPVYERCSLTPSMPKGVAIVRPHVQAIVSVEEQGDLRVNVRYDVPEGIVVRLEEAAVRIDLKNGSSPRLGVIDGINPVAPARHPETPVIEGLLLPVNAAMRGGRLQMGAVSSDKHFWIIAPFPRLSADDLWVQLPPPLVDGASVMFDEVHFTRQPAIGIGVFNC